MSHYPLGGAVGGCWFPLVVVRDGVLVVVPGPLVDEVPLFVVVVLEVAEEVRVVGNVSVGKSSGSFSGRGVGWGRLWVSQFAHLWKIHNHYIDCQKYKMNSSIYFGQSQWLARAFQFWPFGQEIGKAIPPWHLKNLVQSCGSFNITGGLVTPCGHLESTLRSHEFQPWTFDVKITKIGRHFMKFIILISTSITELEKQTSKLQIL